MSTALPICRVGKIHSTGKSTPRSVMGHLARTRLTRNADPGRTAENLWFIGGSGMDLSKTILARLDESGIKPRSNAVIACDLILSLSHNFFTPKNDPESEVLDSRKIRSFQDVALNFAKERFGSRIVAAVLHLDEYTPHLQIVMIPLIIPGEAGEKSRLSARDMFSRENLIALQQAWEDVLRPLGVGRRTQRSAVHHIDAQQYGGCIAAIKGVDPTAEIKIQLPAPRRFESAHAYTARVEPWKAEEELRLKRSMRPLLGLALEGKLARASRPDGSKLRGHLREANRSKSNLQAWGNRLRIELDQHSPPSASAIAAALGVPSLNVNMSPIAAVMQHHRTSRHHALYFLAKTFGSEAAANIMREEIVFRFSKLDFDRVAGTWQTPTQQANTTLSGP